MAPFFYFNLRILPNLLYQAISTKLEGSNPSSCGFFLTTETQTFGVHDDQF